MIGLCRDTAGHIIERSYKVVELLKQRDAKLAVNVDDLLLRESMDVIGGHCLSHLPLLHNRMISLTPATLQALRLLTFLQWQVSVK